MLIRSGARGIAALLLLLGLFATPLANASSNAHPEPEKALSQFRVDTWTVEDGLPASVVEEILQTADGYLWLGTQLGLARFDGLDFDVYNKSSKLGLSAESINAMLEASDGTLWAGTRTGGLIRYRDGKFKMITTADGLPSDEIGTIAEGQDGVIWVGLVDSSVVRIHPDGKIDDLHEEVGVNIVKINSLVVDERGAVWIGTREDGLFLYDDGVVTSFRATGALAFQDISSLALGMDGAVWVGSRDQGLARLHGYRVFRFSESDGLPAGGITALSSDAGGSVWLGTSNEGLMRWTAQAGFEHLAVADGHVKGTINSIRVDREGSVWVGSATGLSRLRDSRFVTFGDREGLLGKSVNTIMEARDGVVWAGGPGGLTRIENSRVSAVGEGLGEIYAVGETPNGTIWVGGRDGLATVRGANTAGIGRRDGFEGEAPIYGLYVGMDGNLWISASDGLYVHANETYRKVGQAQGLSSDAVTFVLESRRGHMWIGTYDGGLNRLENGRVTAVYDKDHGLTSDYITALFEDEAGTLWFGAREAGLYRLENGVLHNYRIEDGLPSDYALSIHEDREGRLWVSSVDGLYRIDRSELLAHSRGEVESLNPVVYRTEDGLRANEFNGGMQPSGWMGRDGRLWLPSVAGAVSVDPYKTNDIPPLILLEQFLVGKQDVDLSTITEIDPGAPRYEFDYTSPGFIAPASTRFEYRLEGFDRAWTDAGTERKAYYTNLRPGTYTFRVRAQNADGVWSQEEARVTFIRLPFFWETIWFRLLAILMFAGLAFGAYRWRVRQMEARAEELEQVVKERTSDLRAEKERTEQLLVATDTARREAEEQREIAEEARSVIEEQADQLREMDRIKMRFFNNISHEFRTPLTLNIGPMENALMGVYGKLAPEMRRQTEVMLRNSRRLLRLINQLLDLSKLESGRMGLRVRENHVDQLVEGIVLSFTPFAEKKELALTFEVEPDADYLMHFDPINLEKVFFNLLSNAIKFTPEQGDIGVRMSKATLERDDARSDAVRVSVSDSGQGIPAHELAHIFDRFHQVDGTVSQVQEGTGIGLSLVKELVDLHSGEIEVESEVGVGTTFHITLPMDVSWLSDYEILSAEDPDGMVARGPMVEMAVFEEDSEEHEGPTVPDDAPLVLVVDDSPDVREYVASCLRAEFRVKTANDGQKGIDKAKEIRPDLIVSDVMMPVMNGYELCRTAKADADLVDTPIILVTSKASADDKVEGLQAGADDYVAKPFSARELIARVRNLLQMSAQHKSLQRLNSTLVESNDALRSANEMKTQLLSIASHDMKNPLTAIREFSRIIREELSNESHLVELLDLVYDSSNEMLALITQLLDSAALESGKLEVKRVEADLSAIAKRVVKRNSRVAERKGQKVHFSAHDGSCLVSADPERIQEAMDNLLSNAIKYSPLQKNIYVQTRASQDEILFEVRDEGPGLTEEDKMRAFGKFQRLSASPTGGETSTGLGLSIVKQIAELHGGRAWVDSQEGEGAIFSFGIPTDRAHAPDRDPKPRNESAASPDPSWSETKA